MEKEKLRLAFTVADSYKMYYFWKVVEEEAEGKYNGRVTEDWGVDTRIDDFHSKRK